MNPILQFNRVSCIKGNTQILNEITHSIQQGEIVTVLGRSGAGKSTLLRCAVALDEISEGTIQFHGKNIQEWNLSELRRQMGMVLQLPYLFPGSVEDNLLYGPRIHHCIHNDGSELVGDILHKVGLPTEFAKRRTSDLSVGQQMRVSLGRTLANQPEILLLDEPTASLDAQSERYILDLIRKLNQDHGYTIVCVIHKLDSARALGGRSLILDQGHIALEGDIDAILHQTDSPVVQALLAGSLS